MQLRVTVQDPEFPVGVSTLAPLLPRLWASTVFQIDRTGTLVQGGSPPHAPSVRPRCTLMSVMQYFGRTLTLFQKKDKGSEIRIFTLYYAAEPGVQGHSCKTVGAHWPFAPAVPEGRSHPKSPGSLRPWRCHWVGAGPELRVQPGGRAHVRKGTRAHCVHVSTQALPRPV